MPDSTLYPSIQFTKRPLRNKELKAEMEEERKAIDRCFNEAVGLEDFYDRVSEIGIDQTKYPYDASAGRFDLEVNEERLRRMDERMHEVKRRRQNNTERDINRQIDF